MNTFFPVFAVVVCLQLYTTSSQYDFGFESNNEDEQFDFDSLDDELMERKNEEFKQQQAAMDLPGIDSLKDPPKRKEDINLESRIKRLQSFHPELTKTYDGPSENGLVMGLSIDTFSVDSTLESEVDQLMKKHGVTIEMVEGPLKKDQTAGSFEEGGFDFSFSLNNLKTTDEQLLKRVEYLENNFHKADMAAQSGLCASNPCLNGGVCSMQGDSYSCRCPDTYIGNNCETQDLCAPNPCLNGGVCSKQGDSYSCSCPDAYIGNNCETQDLCAPNPCLNGGVCSKQGDSYSCSCPDAYIGNNCETQDLCAPNPCLNGGVCSMQGDSYTCRCPDTYIGNNCETQDLCASKPCLNGGVCSMQGDSYSCRCPDTYIGNNCETQDLCAPKPCLNGGVCSMQGDSYSCSCPDAYIGNNCQTQDLCAPNPCLNGGVCSMQGDSYSCRCLDAYIGNNCETQDLCAPIPCLNGGMCSMQGESYSCRCPDEYIGNNYLCAPKPCLNGGVCSMQGDSYSCRCPDAYIGNNCETQDLCVPKPCLNGGVCSLQGDSYSCRCPDAYIGNKCETQDLCAPKPCLNGGVCSMQGDSYSCRCPDAYIGNNCETQDLCAPKPCLNGGVCSMQGDSYSCRCPDTYIGNNCETQDLCAPKPCLNGGVCSKQGDSYSCRCPDAFIGNNCETLDVCAPNPCLNGGACFLQEDSYYCRCRDTFIGNNCETQDSRLIADPCLYSPTLPGARPTDMGSIENRDFVVDYICQHDNVFQEGQNFARCTNKSGIWQLSTMICAPTECFHFVGGYGVYAGTKSTVLGSTELVPCQRWNSQYPQNHAASNNFPYFFHATNLSDVENYCRDPDGKGVPWCYTTDPEKRWQFCDIPKCSPGPSCSIAPFVPGGKVASLTRHRNVEVTYAKYDCLPGLVKMYNTIAECYDDGNGNGDWYFANLPCLPTDCYFFYDRKSQYIGTKATTKTGLTCQRWNVLEPHRHTYNFVMLFPAIDRIDEAENYCRDPEGREMPWCYTTNPDVRWEYCDIKLCDFMGTI